METGTVIEVLEVVVRVRKLVIQGQQVMILTALEKNSG